MSVWELPKDGRAGVAAAEAAAAKFATKMSVATAAVAAGDFPADGRLHVVAGASRSSLNRMHCHQYRAAAVVVFLRHSSIQSPSFFPHVS